MTKTLPSPFIRIRPETRTILNAIARDRGWTLIEAAHRIAEEFVRRESISTSKPRKSHRTAPRTTPA